MGTLGISIDVPGQIFILSRCLHFLWAMLDDGNKAGVLFTPLHLSTAIPSGSILLDLTCIMLGASLEIQTILGLAWNSKDPTSQKWPNGGPEARSRRPGSYHYSLHRLSALLRGSSRGKQWLGGWMSCQTNPQSLPLGFFTMWPVRHPSTLLLK